MYDWRGKGDGLRVISKVFNGARCLSCEEGLKRKRAWDTLVWFGLVWFGLGGGNSFIRELQNSMATLSACFRPALTWMVLTNLKISARF